MVLKRDLCHDDILTLFDEFIFSFDNRLEEFEVLDVAAVCFDAVDKMLNHALVDLAAQLEVIHKYVLHSDGF